MISLLLTLVLALSLLTPAASAVSTRKYTYTEEEIAVEDASDSSPARRAAAAFR